MLVSTSLRMYNEEQSRINSPRFNKNFEVFKEKVLKSFGKELNLNCKTTPTTLIIVTPYDIEQVYKKMTKSKKTTGLTSMIKKLTILSLDKNKIEILLSKNTLSKQISFECSLFEPVRVKLKDGTELADHVEVAGDEFFIDILLDEFNNNSFMHNKKLEISYINAFSEVVYNKLDVEKALLSGKYILFPGNKEITYSYIRSMTANLPIKCFTLYEEGVFKANLNTRRFMQTLSKETVRKRRAKTDEKYNRV